MADFVDCDFNEFFENDEPLAKKRRGANVKYKFVEEVESSDDLKINNFVDVENIATDIKGYESELVEFKYRIDEEDPKKTEWEMILTCKKLLDEQRSQNHGNFDSTFKLIFTLQACSSYSNNLQSSTMAKHACTSSNNTADPFSK